MGYLQIQRLILLRYPAALLKKLQLRQQVSQNPLQTDLLLIGFRVRIPLTSLPFSSLIRQRFVVLGYL